MLNRRTLTIAAVGGISAAAGALLWQVQQQTVAPAVRYVRLNGQAADSSAWRGKVMLVNFWATSCATCIKKMPSLVSTHRKYQPKGFDVLAVAMQYDPPAYVAQFAKTRQLPFDVAIDNTGAIAHAFGDVRVTPTTVLIDKQGHIVKRLIGEIEEAQLHALVEQLLAAY